MEEVTKDFVTTTNDLVLKSVAIGERVQNYPKQRDVIHGNPFKQSNVYSLVKVAGAVRYGRIIHS
jgi:hypothetical protein